MSVTIREVAQRAGVSVATVSRVLNSSGPVREATRARIEQAAAELQYVPNGAARSLITSRTQTLGVILPDLYGAFFSEVIRGIDAATRERGYHLLVSSSHSDRGELRAVLHSMTGRVDGLLVMSPHVDAGTVQALIPDKVPAVLLGSTSGPVAARAHIRMDNAGGAAAVARHLVALGHPRLVFLAGPADNADAKEREAGFFGALAHTGTAAEVIRGDFTEHGGHDAARRALDAFAPPFVLAAANDSMAIGAMLALREGGLDVPGDVAVTGFDDLPIGRYFSPPLTTVHVAVGEMGGRATARLIALLEDASGDSASGDGAPADVPHTETIPARLVVRASCGAGG